MYQCLVSEAPPLSSVSFSLNTVHTINKQEVKIMKNKQYYPKAVSTDEVLNELCIMARDMTIDDFASIFYGLRPNQDPVYMREKYGYFQRNGIMYAINNLDGPNTRRVCKYIEAQIYGAD